MDWRVKVQEKCFLYISIVIMVIALQTRHGRASQDDDEKLVASVNNFTFNFYNQLVVQNRGSFICSPYSAAVALTMLLVGARTDTADEITNTLGYHDNGLSTEQVQHVYHKLLSDQNTNKKGFNLSIANSFWVKLGAQLLPEYKLTVQDSFLAEGKEVDFKNSSTLNEINNWISKQTKGKISGMLTEIDPDTFLMLINAVYFKGEWKYLFKSSLTRNKNFKNVFSGLTKKVPMMRTRGTYQYAHAEFIQSKIIQLPYKGNEYSMIIILPNKDNGLLEVERQLTADLFHHAIDMCSETKLDLYLPRFNLNTTEKLNDVLISLGTKLVFSKSADLSGINERRSLYVSKVIQKTICEVNENGTIAAAVTVLDTALRSIPRVPLRFSVDHPFLFLIQHTNSGLILFTGRVLEL